MNLFSFFCLLAFVYQSCASASRNVKKDEWEIIPSAARTSPELSSESSRARLRPHAKHINEFFKSYGWLKSNESVPDTELPKAVEKIQHALNEPVTGIITDNLTKILTAPRCGTLQPYNDTAAKSPTEHHKRYVVWGPKWALSTLTWKLVAYSVTASREYQQSTIT